MRMFLEDEIGNSSGMNDGRGRMKTNGSNWKRAWALLLMIFVLAAPLAAQAPSQGEEVGLRLDVDKRQLEVGESLSLIIEFKQLVVGGNVISAEPNLPTPELFQARSSSTSTQVTIVNQKTAQVTTTHITLEAVKPGSETLGPASVIFQDPSGKRREITSNVINVTVTEKKGFSIFGGAKPTPPPEGNQPSTSQPDDALRGLKPLLPDPLLFLFKAGLLILILLLIVGFIGAAHAHTGQPADPRLVIRRVEHDREPPVRQHARLVRDLGEQARPIAIQSRRFDMRDGPAPAA